MGDIIDRWLARNTTRYSEPPSYEERQRTHKSSRAKYGENTTAVIDFKERKKKLKMWRIFDTVGKRILDIPSNSQREAEEFAMRTFGSMVGRVEAIDP